MVSSGDDIACFVGSQGGDWETKSLANFGNGQNKTLYVNLLTIVLSNEIAQISQFGVLDKNILLHEPRHLLLQSIFCLYIEIVASLGGSLTGQWRTFLSSHSVNCVIE
jgi:hypothetical protein